MQQKTVSCTTSVYYLDTCSHIKPPACFLTCPGQNSSFPATCLIFLTHTPVALPNWLWIVESNHYCLIQSEVHFRYANPQSWSVLPLHHGTNHPTLLGFTYRRAWNYYFFNSRLRFCSSRRLARIALPSLLKNENSHSRISQISSRS